MAAVLWHLSVIAWSRNVFGTTHWLPWSRVGDRRNSAGSSSVKWSENVSSLTAHRQTWTSPSILVPFDSEVALVQVCRYSMSEKTVSLHLPELDLAENFAFCHPNTAGICRPKTFVDHARQEGCPGINSLVCLDTLVSMLPLEFLSKDCCRNLQGEFRDVIHAKNLLRNYNRTKGPTTRL